MRKAWQLAAGMVAGAGVWAHIPNLRHEAESKLKMIGTLNYLKALI